MKVTDRNVAHIVHRYLIYDMQMGFHYFTSLHILDQPAMS